MLTVRLVTAGRAPELAAVARYVNAWPFTLAGAANWARPLLSWLTVATVCQEDPCCTWRLTFRPAVIGSIVAVKAAFAASGLATRLPGWTICGNAMRWTVCVTYVRTDVAEVGPATSRREAGMSRHRALALRARRADMEDFLVWR